MTNVIPRRRDASIAAQFRVEALARGIPWRLVREAAADIRREAREGRELLDATRRDAWIIHCGNKRRMWPFWRHGFASWYGRRLERSDYTCIPRYDLTFQEICSWHPYWVNVGIDAFFEFLLSPYKRLPTAAEIYPEALNRAAAWSDFGQAETVSDSEPFV